MPSVYAIATMDTKGAELAFVKSLLAEAGVSVVSVDVGTHQPPTVPPDIGRDQVLGAQGATVSIANDRGTAVRQMSRALSAFLASEWAAGKLAGVIGLGGSGGTSLITAAMRALPIGLPKVMVSTVASGNVVHYVDCSDITMMYSVVDIAGINSVSATILANAAHAIAGMVSRPLRATAVRPAVGMTMFGVTTPCVTRVRQELEDDGFDCLVFHATGTGGRSMEQLVASGFLAGVLDITTTEVADEIVGGIFPCGPSRFEALLAAEIPVVISLGALDMVNFGAMETVPAEFRGRNLYRHNDQVTLMRTDVDENRKIAAFIAQRLNRSVAPLRLLIPEGGLSLLDLPGQPFHDIQADRALFDELASRLDLTPQRQLIRLSCDINAPEFSDALIKNFRELLKPLPLDKPS